MLTQLPPGTSVSALAEVCTDTPGCVAFSAGQLLLSYTLGSTDSHETHEAPGVLYVQLGERNWHGFELPDLLSEPDTEPAFRLNSGHGSNKGSTAHHPSPARRAGNGLGPTPPSPITGDMPPPAPPSPYTTRGIPEAWDSRSTPDGQNRVCPVRNQKGW